MKGLPTLFEKLKNARPKQISLLTSRTRPQAFLIFFLLLLVSVCNYGCVGLTSATKTQAAAPSKIAVSNVLTSSLTANAAIISWATNVGGSSQVLYGTSSSYGQSTALNNTMVTSHSVSLTGLSASTTYHYQVISVDGSGNASNSGDLTFSTPPANGAPPTVSVTGPAPGATVSGSVVTVSASATASQGLTVSSVQFLLNGGNLGPQITAAPGPIPGIQPR